MNNLAKQIETDLQKLLLLEHFELSLDSLDFDRESTNLIIEIFKDTISVNEWNSIQFLDYYGFEYERFSKPQLIEHLHKSLVEIDKELK
ncbi:hypothetical protein [Gottfriedia solisilvae]|uniref:hypothetical protein n=1 Tax=Gottfriedia solisilvae TaxID=1516104 RepID=UPI003D2EF03A